MSYALDGKVTIDRSTAQRQPIVKASVADGVMRIGRVLRWTTTYRVKSAGPPPQALLIEQPRRPGAVLTSPDPKTVELTPEAYRIPANLPADGDGSLTVVEEKPIEETIRLLDVDENRLGVLVSSAELDPKMRQALADLAARRRDVARQRAELDRLQAQRARLIEDENRLRANLAAVGNEPGLRRSQLEKFAETESAIERISAAVADGLGRARRGGTRPRRLCQFVDAVAATALTGRRAMRPRRLAQRSRSFGSSTSRSELPNRLMPNTVSMIASPGKTAIHGAVVAYSSAPPCSISPQAGTGSCTPRPR